MKKLLSLILAISITCGYTAFVSAESSDTDFSASDTPDIQGDVNKDGKIGTEYFKSFIKFFFGNDTDSSASTDDMNGDGKVNILDCIECKRKVIQSAKMSDFKIEDGVLTGYEGSDTVVEIPDTVTAIDDRAFWSNKIIKAVFIPGTVKSIGDHAFWSCAALEFIDIAEGVESLGNLICWSCPSLKDVNLPHSINKVSEYYDCFGASPELKIHLPADYEGTVVEQIALRTISHNGTGWVTNYDCEHVNYTPVKRNHPIEAEEYEYGKFTEFTIPQGTDYIGARAFIYCKALEEICIPDSVKEIGGDAFEYCEMLKTVYIENGCEIIGDGVFEYCQNLRDITIPSSVTSIKASSINHCHDSLVIHCPEGSYAEQYAISRKLKYDHKMDRNVSDKPVTTATTTVTTNHVVTSTTSHTTTSVPVTTVKMTTTVKPVTTPPITTSKPVSTTAQKKFDLNSKSQFSVSSDDLHNGVWDAVISNTSEGSNYSPALSWTPVDNAESYVIYMVDTSANNWMHWKSGNITKTELPSGWARSSEYIGPYPPSGTHRYEIYIFALKNSPSQLKGNFDDENSDFSSIISSLDKDSAGESGNMFSYGHISGTYTR